MYVVWSVTVWLCVVGHHSVCRVECHCAAVCCRRRSVVSSVTVRLCVVGDVVLCGVSLCGCVL